MLVRRLLHHPLPTYLPYSIPILHFSTRIRVPRDELTLSFSRSSGPGGQNVNRVATKAEIRFRLEDADWLDVVEGTRERLAKQFSRCVTKKGDFVVVSQKFRSQGRNVEDAIQNLQAMVDEACVPPKERKVWKGLAKKTKDDRVAMKKKRSEVKQRRRKGRDFDL